MCKRKFFLSVCLQSVKVLLYLFSTKCMKLNNLFDTEEIYLICYIYKRCCLHNVKNSSAYLSVVCKARIPYSGLSSWKSSLISFICKQNVLQNVNNLIKIAKYVNIFITQCKELNKSVCPHVYWNVLFLSRFVVWFTYFLHM